MYLRSELPAGLGLAVLITPPSCQRKVRVTGASVLLTASSAERQRATMKSQPRLPRGALLFSLSLLVALAACSRQGGSAARDGGVDSGAGGLGDANSGGASDGDAKTTGPDSSASCNVVQPTAATIPGYSYV